MRPSASATPIHLNSFCFGILTSGFCHRHFTSESSRRRKREREKKNENTVTATGGVFMSKQITILRESEM